MKVLRLFDYCLRTGCPKLLFRLRIVVFLLILIKHPTQFSLNHLPYYFGVRPAMNNIFLMLIVPDFSKVYIIFVV